jgi:ketosteroid isomerase-like protein
MRLGVWIRLSAVASLAVLALLATARPHRLDAAPADDAGRTHFLILDSGVAADDDLDRLYKESGAAFMARTAAPLGDFYTEDALYLEHENPAGSPITRGREAIADGFQRYFKFLDEHGHRVVESTARVIAREKAGDFAYDVGYWRMTTTIPGKDPVVTVWKYSNVFRRGADGRWQVHVETTMPTKAEAFEG